MKKILFFAISLLLISSCRPVSEEQLSYGQNDNLVYNNASASFEQQFISLWTALNSNYGIWDYELEHGLDWDEVYHTYLPKFKSLDEQQTVSDEELQALYGEFLNKLHDGHLLIQVANLNNRHFINFSPSQTRNATRKDYESTANFAPNLAAYTGIAGDMHIVETKEASASQITVVVTCVRNAMAVLGPTIETLSQKEHLTEQEALTLKYSQELVQALNDINGKPLDYIYVVYNQLCDKYAMLAESLGFALIPVDIKTANYALSINYALFESGIVYLYFSDCNLSAYLDPVYFNALCDAQSQNSQIIQKAIESVWSAWFDKIQELKKTNSLKGVIIDVRNNPGGFLQDSRFAIGALMPQGDFSSHSVRSKNGIGRYDYSPITPFTYKSYEGEHEVISDEPVVVLANCRSVSMAEMTAQGAKSMPNGRVVGTNTWGGICGLNTSPTNYSITYAGVIGVQNQTSFYAYIPKYISILPELGIQEGVGVTPDIAIDFDQNLFESTGRDSQLESAINYILKGE